MNDKQGRPTANKALVAAAAPVVMALVMAMTTGEFDDAEFSVALAGLITAVLVYVTPYFKQGVN